MLRDYLHEKYNKLRKGGPNSEFLFFNDEITFEFKEVAAVMTSTDLFVISMEIDMPFKISTALADAF